MASPITIRDLMFEGIVNQPSFNMGPFVLCRNALRNYPKHAMTFFNDDGDWGRVSYQLDDDSQSYTIKQLTKQEDIFLEETDITAVKKRLKDEANNLDAIILFNKIAFPNNKEVELNKVSKILMSDTSVFMINYVRYQNYLLHKEIDRIRKSL